MKPKSVALRVCIEAPSLFDGLLDTSQYFVGRCSMSGHIPTFADLCSAIAEGEVSAAVDGSMYRVNALELRRYINKFRPLPSISTSRVRQSGSCTGVNTWSAPSRPSPSVA